MSIDIERVERTRAIKQQNLRRLLSRRNVVGVGVGFKESNGVLTEEVAVTVNVVKKLPVAQLAESDMVPRDLDGVKTDVIETGRFLAGAEATAQAARPTDRWRPVIPCGVSIGHLEVTAGTLGCLVQRRGQIYLLSNNHVLANVNAASTGDPIIQPGRYDGGGPADEVATLAAFVPIDFGSESANCQYARGVENTLNWLAERLGSQHRVMAYRTAPGENLVDAALARPNDPNQFTPEILNIGRPKGVREATLGTKVQKSGRTTGHTQGQIIQIDVTTSVDYNGRTATFVNQLMASGMSSGGDSGSAVLDEEGYVVGLLYAGSMRATLINPIQTVLEILDVELVL
ncbi:MAG: hypothetical protein D6784_06205 [Chloroflexi bacterium]|nr:MAG: hypothetical protein D6784_06205 [Chloroflexota bacterium]